MKLTFLTMAFTTFIATSIAAPPVRRRYNSASVYLNSADGTKYEKIELQKGECKEVKYPNTAHSVGGDMGPICTLYSECACQGQKFGFQYPIFDLGLYGFDGKTISVACFTEE